MKARPVFLMIITLLIGFLLGVLTSAQLRHKRMRPLRIYSSEQQFREGAYSFIEPGEEQVEVLDEIISRYGKEGSELQRSFRREFDALMNNFWSELELQLTEEQLNSMREIVKQRRGANRRFRSDSADFNSRPFPGSRHRGMPGGYSRFSVDSVNVSDSLMVMDSGKVGN